MLSNYYWISAPCFAIILVIILLKESRWFKSPSPLARSLYAMLFFAMVHSLPVSAIDLSISNIVDGRTLFFPMEITSFVTGAVLFVFWANFILRYVKSKPFVFFSTIIIASLIALAGIILVSFNFIETFHQPHPIVSHYVDVWRRWAWMYRVIVYIGVVYMALRRILRKLLKKEKIKTRYVASFTAAIVPLCIDLLFWSNLPVCSLTLSTSCLILYIYSVSNERNEMQHSKEMFLENMSHEIRTTLNSVYGFAQLLCLPEGTWSAEERQTYANHIHNSYNMLDMLLNDLMVSTRYDTHSYNVRKEPTDVMAAIDEAISAVKVCVPSSVTMTVSSKLPAGFTIMSDGRRIRQIVQNLLTNASQYIVEGNIQLALQLNGQTLKIFVTANLPASTAAAKQNTEASITKHKTGMGLRQMISRKMAMLIGGTVTRDMTYTNGIKYEVKLTAKEVKETTGIPVVPPQASLAPAQSI